MDHNLFKPKDLEDGKNGVVGDCNGIPMDVRYKEETPVFAKKILSLCEDQGEWILDYGCGVGRLSKELLAQDEHIRVVGLDASAEMCRLARENINGIDINSINFSAVDKESIDKEKGFDIAVLVYVLQHIPAIEIREALQRIHHSLKDDGILFYCSSDYRMAIRFDGQGFFDDRCLGVNLQEEISRFFDLVGPAFTHEEIKDTVCDVMINGKGGGLAHPCLIYRKKKITGPLFNASLCGVSEPAEVNQKPTGIKECEEIKPIKLILSNPLAPGDMLVSTNAIRDLHKAFPGEYLTDIRVPSGGEQVFKNSPYITPIADGEEDKRIRLNYSGIHTSGENGLHFGHCHTIDLEKELGLTIPRTGIRPDIFLDDNERLWPSPVVVKTGYEGKYWVINAGVKDDRALKQYPYYQDVEYLFNIAFEGKIALVQIGQLEHIHEPLKGVIDMRGKTDLRELFRVIYHAEGVLTPVSLPMHAAAALRKPCVVVAGGREPTKWELYPDHRFLYVNGALECCPYNGCWKTHKKGALDKDKNCTNLAGDIPLCMTLIRPEDVVRAIELYYLGGRLKRAKQ